MLPQLTAVDMRARPTVSIISDMEKWGYLAYVYAWDSVSFAGVVHVPDYTAIDIGSAHVLVKADQLSRLERFAQNAHVHVVDVSHALDYDQQNTECVKALCELHNGDGFSAIVHPIVSSRNLPLASIQQAAKEHYIINVMHLYAKNRISPCTLVPGNLYAAAYAALLALAICCKRAGIPKDVFRSCIGPRVWHSRLEEGVWPLPEEAQRAMSVRRKKRKY